MNVAMIERSYHRDQQPEVSDMCLDAHMGDAGQADVADAPMYA